MSILARRLAREFLAVVERNGWTNLEITCLPAIWHNRPEKIPGGVRRKIRAARGRYERILVLYGDCGTGGGGAVFDTSERSNRDWPAATRSSDTTSSSSAVSCATSAAR